jgi:hypothetical protein
VINNHRGAVKSLAGQSFRQRQSARHSR